MLVTLLQDYSPMLDVSSYLRTMNMMRATTANTTSKLLSSIVYYPFLLKPTLRWGGAFVKYLTAYVTHWSYNPSMKMTVCLNCAHKRSFHKKVDGNAWCSVNFCACKEFIEAEVPFNRRAIHEALDQFLDDYKEK